MAFNFNDATTSIEDNVAGSTSILDKNTLTTAGVLLAAGGAVSGGILLTAALPVPTLTIAIAAGGMVYAGDRQSKDLPILPWMKSEDAPTETVVAKPATVVAS